MLIGSASVPTAERSHCKRRNVDQLSCLLLKDRKVQATRTLQHGFHVMAGTSRLSVSHRDASFAAVTLQGFGRTAEGSRRSGRGQAEGVSPDVNTCC